MQSLIQFPIDLARTSAALEQIADHLSHIREALERLAPPLPVQPEPTVAKLSDLRSTDPHTVGRIRQELDIYARERNVVLDSDAFFDSIMQFEREVAEVYGQQAVLELPWNKTAGGSLFATVSDRIPRIRQERGTPSPQAVGNEADDQGRAGDAVAHAGKERD